jgi:hypothetical protein
VQIIKSKYTLLKEMLSDKKITKDENTELEKSNHKQLLARYTETYKNTGNPKRRTYNVVRTDRIIASLQEDCRLRRCTMFEFFPYCGGKDKNPYADSEVYNKFGGYYLEEYAPTVKYKIEDTLLYRYFKVVFGWSEETITPRCDEIWNRIAFWLQFPRIRTHALYCIFSQEQGTGKSFFYEVLKAVMGKNLTTFHLSLDTYITGFDMSNSGMLVHVIDDLVGAKKKTRQLFSRITTGEQIYQAKYLDPVRLDEYSEVIVTGNDEACSFHVVADDRRIMIWEVCPKLKPDIKFWIALAEEVLNLDKMKAWYVFFKTRDLSKFNYKDVLPEIANSKTSAIMKQRPKSHTFIEDYFKSDSFLTDYGCGQIDWLKNMSVSAIKKGRKPKARFGQVRIRIEQKQLYWCYTVMMKQLYSGSRAHDFGTFSDEIKRLGAIPGDRKRIKPNGLVRDVFDFYWPDFKKLHKKLYAVEPKEWFTADPIKLETVSRQLR